MVNHLMRQFLNQHLGFLQVARCNHFVNLQIFRITLCPLRRTWHVFRAAWDVRRPASLSGLYSRPTARRGIRSIITEQHTMKDLTLSDQPAPATAPDVTERTMPVSTDTDSVDHITYEDVPTILGASSVRDYA